MYKLIFEKRGMLREFNYIGFGLTEAIPETLQEDISTISECNRIQAWLGGIWSVDKCDGVFILSKAGSVKSLYIEDNT